ncbi:GATA transcription factor 2-like [Macadamia integrifolia]|uniref:GATA transcription factor 2-like n=1 Tax=Macadamia integrifolia TaxID=60698 RepID=UPI001C52C860|nr:GATA transcription factor 2-like [Macadamia integrifolia]
MDFCRNLSVSGGLQSELPPEQVMTPACSKLGGFSGPLDELFPSENTEGDVGLEWLSIFVEDCLSSSGICIPAPTNTQNNQTPEASKPSKKNHQNPSLRDFVIPGKARSKRKRATATPLRNCSHLGMDPHSQPLLLSSSDPPLLQQAYWLADSELMVPKKEKKESNSNSNSSRSSSSSSRRNEEERREEKMVVSKESSEGGSVVQPRRCTHCLAQRTPQWRAGPSGPKTLCNACGVRFKSGRLLPEYRPAKSPTFVSYKHSNSHKKVMEMRMSVHTHTE